MNTPELVTNAERTVVWKSNRTPFGEEDPEIALVEQPFRFPGQYYDAETGLYYNLNRYYHPGLGRYITSDPIGLDGGINTYGYAYQNPIMYYDPRGEAVWFLLPWLIGAGEGIAWSSVIWTTGQWTLLAALSMSIASSSDMSSSEECDESEEECIREVSECKALCRRAQNDPDMQNVWGGSWAQCLLGCVSWRCMNYVDL
ncbi:MAG: hypothetical protein CMK83_10915 [Pseudomonadales bacterium]|nr:hypothetical protein [Pseudomonadales bacterium]